jgi:hypothetical protein
MVFIDYLIVMSLSLSYLMKYSFLLQHEYPI